MLADNRTRSNRYKQKHRKFHLHMKTNFTVRVTEHWNRLPERRELWRLLL